MCVPHSPPSLQSPFSFYSLPSPSVPNQPTEQETVERERDGLLFGGGAMKKEEEEKTALLHGLRLFTGMG